MVKRRKGFTLIELLIVVAVIGILSAIIVPNTLTSIQKANQKQTMKDIVSIATACASYVTEAGYAPDYGNQSGPLQPNSDFATALAPLFIKVCPLNDLWGNPFQVYTGTAVSNAYSIPATGLGDDDFLIASLGRDGAVGGSVTYTYQAGNPLAGLYIVNSMDDFTNDLINLNGSWLHAPRIADVGS
jgi:type II secretion system protein G